MKVKKAIIPAAGLGTRVLPASKAVPKEMLNIVDKLLFNILLRRRQPQELKISLLLQTGQGRY
jgi:UTP--glucose-1-phosphate uridylyltransferase